MCCRCMPTLLGVGTVDRVPQFRELTDKTDGMGLRGNSLRKLLAEADWLNKQFKVMNWNVSALPNVLQAL